MKLARFEWKKIFSGKIPGIFLTFFLLNLLACYLYMMPFLPTKAEQDERKEWKAVLDTRNESIADTLIFLQEESKKVSDNLSLSPKSAALSAELKVLGDFEKEYQTVLDYHDFIENLENRVEKMQTFAIFNKEGGFSKRNIEKTARDFEDMKSQTLLPADDSGMNALHNFYLTDLLLILLACLFSFQEYSRDSRTGMASLIQSTPGGKGRLRLAQIAGLGLSVLLSYICLYGSNFLLIGINLGFGSPDALIQGMSMFRNVSFPCTVSLYLFYFFLWKAAAIMFITLIFQFFAVWFNGHFLSWILNFLLLGFSFLLWFLLPDSSFSRLFRYLNPIGILDTRQILGNYQNLNFFQYPVSLLVTAILFLGVMSLFLCAGILLVDRKLIHLPSLSFPFCKRKRVWKRIFSYECYKLIVNQKVWILLILLIPISILWVTPWQNRVRLADYSYEQFLDVYEGSYTDQKFQDIQAIPQQTDSQVQEGLDRLREQADYLHQSQAKKKGFVSIRILDDFFQNPQQDTKNMMMMTSILLLSVSSLFFVDKKQQMQQLLYSYPRSAHVYWNKIKLSAFIGFYSALCIWGTAWIKFFLHHKELEGLSYSLQSLPVFAQVPYTGSIFSYMLISFVLRLVSGIYLGVFLAFLVQLLPAPAQNITCSVILLTLPLCMSYIENLGYENPLISFISNYLSPAMKHVKLLCQFPAQWFLIKSGWLVFIFLLPVVCLSLGFWNWQKRSLH